MQKVAKTCCANARQTQRVLPVWQPTSSATSKSPACGNSLFERFWQHYYFKRHTNIAKMPAAAAFELA
eukprot:m.58144 g.58144  ORF g.58144 m.58144 type:complete len:68 (-) comp12829_c0_seq3:144-347(-)